MFKKVATVVATELVSEQRFNLRQADRKIVEYDPEFVYVAVRALTADKPNSNGDCFPHDELIRIDAVLHRPVYASFIGKGVYVNHRNTDDPRHAKGVVLDARYVTANPNDKYVELLLGVDKKKDPIFARDVERGIINKFSMGASVQFTKCSVCNNEARKKEEFCDHISKSKMREIEGKLAYELCYGVTYNEISAVSDPADETAQLLAKIANTKKNSANSDHGTVVMLNEIHTAIKRLEAALMGKKVAATKKVAEPMPPADTVPMDAPPEMGMEPGMEPGMEGGMEEERAEIVEMLHVLTDLAEGNVSPEETVEALVGLGFGGPEGAPEPPPGEMAGEPEPPGADMAPMASKESFSAFIKRVAAEYNKNRGVKSMSTKQAAEKSPKVDNQYPYEKRQKDPKQHHTKPQKGRPASDFDKDQKEYAKKFNYISAEFVDSNDRRTAAWKICDERTQTPLYLITGKDAFDDLLNSNEKLADLGNVSAWDRFSSHEYGRDLVNAILEDGLDETMKRVNARVIELETKQAEMTDEPRIDESRLFEAAETKAAELADERFDDFKIRFVEGIKYAFKLQQKNVIDNPIKASAYAVLTRIGADGSLAEEIVASDVVEAHFDEAIKKALEYTEMSEEAFEEHKANVDSLPHTSVVQATASAVGTDSEDISNILEEATRSAMRKRASKNIAISTPAGEGPNRGFDESLRSAVRSGLNNFVTPSSSAPSYRRAGTR